MGVGVGVSVPSPACKHFQKQYEPRPVPVEEGSCSVRRSLQHPLQLPSHLGRDAKKTYACIPSLTVLMVAALDCRGISGACRALLGFSQCCWLLSEGAGEGEEGSARSHPTLRCSSWQGPALPAKQGGKGGLGEPQEA